MSRDHKANEKLVQDTEGLVMSPKHQQECQYDLVISSMEEEGQVRTESTL